jgi:hypothetical protein
VRILGRINDDLFWPITKFLGLLDAATNGLPH